MFEITAILSRPRWVKLRKPNLVITGPVDVHTPNNSWSSAGTTLTIKDTFFIHIYYMVYVADDQTTLWSAADEIPPAHMALQSVWVTQAPLDLGNILSTVRIVAICGNIHLRFLEFNKRNTEYFLKARRHISLTDVMPISLVTLEPLRGTDLH